MKTNKLIEKMLKENTGRHVLDSGGAYGRSWEGNQGKDFTKEPTAWVDLYEGQEICPTASLYHHLCNVLDQDALCKEFNRKFKVMSDWDSEEAYGVSKKAEEWLRENGLKVLDTWNSYNGECNLSQVIQGANVDHEGQSTYEFPKYHLLQIHGGCDVRGGYTDAKLFKAVEDKYLGIQDIYGTVDDKTADAMYNGRSLTYEDSNEEVIYKKGMEVEVYTCE